VQIFRCKLQMWDPSVHESSALGYAMRKSVRHMHTSMRVSKDLAHHHLHSTAAIISNKVESRTLLHKPTEGY